MVLDKNTKFLIIDDDLSYSLELEMLLKNLSYENILVSNTFQSALDSCKSDVPDIIISDVMLDENKTGLEFAKQVSQLNIPFIFLTSYPDDDGLKFSLKLKNSFYLTKPISKYSLSSILANIDSNVDTKLSNRKDSILIKKKGVYEKVKLADIKFIEAQGDHTLIHSVERKFINKTSLQKTYELLKEGSFYKVHRSFVVNLKKIKSIHPNQNLLKIDDFSIPISRNNKSALLNIFNKID